MWLIFFKVMRLLHSLFACFFVVFISAQDTFSPNFSVNAGPYSIEILDKSYQNIYYKAEFVEKPRKSDKKTEALCILQLGKNYSKFVDFVRLRKDSLMAIYSPMGKVGAKEVSRYFALRSNWDNTLVKNISEKKNIMQNYVKADYQYEEQQPVFDWKLEDGTKDILGYSCRKATTEYRGRKYIAWYTTDIPINNGPYAFQGLPGLIMELEDSKNHFHFTAVAMDKKDGNIYVRNEKEIFRVNRKQFRKLQKSYHDNPVFFHNGAYEEDGSSIKLKSKPYNPIELE